jgi:peptidoglycan/xylan/chitin deacetylase (PgdA/CDA1 family)/2-polyprenyl-3-methyl-5-hydroxy-6-metoxy-1,4-benzoquinol methylase
VVIPVRDGVETLPGTLASVVEQSFAHWEAVVVDDRSTDGTAELVAEWTRRDRRIRCIEGDGGGAGAARNAGVHAALGEWLLFLDADDWLVETALERLLEAAEAAPGRAGVYCGWIRVAPDGERFDEHPALLEGNLFAEFAGTCVFAIHTCLVRRSAVERVGGFDRGIRICEDWDLWQRMSRQGAEFGTVGETLALYRARPGTASRSHDQFVRDALAAIERGHGPDPRVAAAAPGLAAGMPPALGRMHRLGVVLWVAGVTIGEGGDPRPLLRYAEPELDPTLAPELVAEILYAAVPLGPGRPPSAWPDLYAGVEARLGDYLAELERLSGAPGLARRTRRILDRTIVAAVGGRVASSEVAHAEVELTAPAADLHATAETMVCSVLLEGEPLGAVTLPVCDGTVPAAVLADALAHRLGWAALGGFFERTLYPSLDVREDGVYRNGALLFPGATAADHDEVGWTVLLQEILGRPDWAPTAFYEPRAAEPGPPLACPDGTHVLDLIDPISSLDVAADRLVLTLRLAGALLGAVALGGGRVVDAHELRVAATLAAGTELAWTAAREAILFRPIDATPLRARLEEARTRASPTDPVTVALAPLGRGVVVARREPGGFGTAAARRAAMPSSVTDDVVQAAAARGDAYATVGESWSRLVYWPDYAPDGSRRSPTPAPVVRRPADEGGVRVPRFDRAYFEAEFVFGRGPANGHQTDAIAVSILPRKQFGRVLELGCADGRLTRLLVPRAHSLVAADISEVALERAAARGLDHVTFVQLDMRRDALPGSFDLIVCADVLQYAGGANGLAAVRERIVAALEPGGYLLSAHADPVGGPVDGTTLGTEAIAEALASAGALELVRELAGPRHRIQLFRKAGRSLVPRRLRAGRDEQPAVDAVAEPEDEIEVVTRALPILMYHRVADGVGGPGAEYALTPRLFEHHLRYLRDAGYRSVALDEWRTAAHERRPLPGRAVAITFDDGYADFLTGAWPLLEEYGFGAAVFLVAELIGQTNAWDRGFAETALLMDWNEIRGLQEEGVVFGSHSLAHPALTGLSNADVVREGVRSRMLLEEGLGREIDSFAYPYGDVDEAVEHLVGACGYTYGLTCLARRCAMSDPLVGLPRIDASSISLAELVRRLGE